MTTGYMMFANEKRSSVVEPGLKVTEVAKKLGALWRALSDEEKKKYNEAAAEHRKSNPPKPRKPRKSKKAKEEAKAAKAAKPKRAPRPLSGYMKFANAKRGEVKSTDPAMKFGEIGKRLGAMWRELSDEEKGTWKLA